MSFPNVLYADLGPFWVEEGKTNAPITKPDISAAQPLEALKRELLADSASQDESHILGTSWVSSVLFDGVSAPDIFQEVEMLSRRWVTEEVRNSLREIDRLVLEERLTNAVKRTENMLEKFPGNSVLIEKVARIYEMMGNDRRAEIFWQMLSTIHDERCEVLAHEGFMSLKLRNWALAEEMLLRSFNLDMKCPATRLYLAAYWMARNDRVKASEALGLLKIFEIIWMGRKYYIDRKEYLKFLPHNGYEYLARLIASGGRHSNVEEIDLRGKKRDEGFFSVSTAKAIDPIPSITMSKKIDPEGYGYSLFLIASHLQRARIALSAKDWKEAETALGLAQDLGASGAAYLLCQARMSAVKLNVEETKKRIDELLNKWPDDPYLLHEVGILYLEMGLIKKAVSYLRKATFKNPTYIKCKFDLACALLLDNSLYQGLPILRNLFDTYPDKTKRWIKGDVPYLVKVREHLNRAPSGSKKH